MNVNEYLRKTQEYQTVVGRLYQRIRPRIVCKDGSSLSVQAGELLYSTPRQDGLSTYINVEVGYPSVDPPESWFEYAEIYSGDDDIKFTDVIYPYIPVELVQQFIDEHGGIDLEESLKETQP